jgi:hypothetical protein
MSQNGRLSMPPSLYRCPVTDQNILTPRADESPAGGTPLYKVVRCSACNRGHLVNLRTGEVLGAVGRPGLSFRKQ